MASLALSPNAIPALIVPASRGTTTTDKKRVRTNRLRQPGWFRDDIMDFLSSRAGTWKSCSAAVRNANI
jgi:hypothetical protein